MDTSSNKDQILQDIFISRVQHLRKNLLKLISEGTARRVIIKKGNRTLANIPLAAGLGSAAAAIVIHAPLAAIAAITALMNEVTIVVYKKRGTIQYFD